MSASTRIIMRDPCGSDRWLMWRNPVEIIATHNLDEVTDILARVDAAANHGLHAIGFVCYEAGRAFDPAFVNKTQVPALPLVWFALFRSDSATEHTLDCPRHSAVQWKPLIDKTTYRRSIRKIKQSIAAGETYQVNFTFPLKGSMPLDMEQLLARLHHAQPSPYSMYIETPDFQIASASPECFFTLDNSRIHCKPMKGTCPRGLHPTLDRMAGENLRHSIKNRAENVMIVDMVRNDLGRIAVAGSVTTERLFDVTAWPTLWQMTSTISADTKANIVGIFQALFPSASITGAPKLKTSEIISGLEDYPRGVYTGAIGYWFPGRQASFSVAIRTATHINHSGETTYGVGSGIVWDSQADDEYRECILKSRVLKNAMPDFQLLETMRWEPDSGFFMLAEHLDRMKESSDYFGCDFDDEVVASMLNEMASKFDNKPTRVRLLCARNGRIRIEHIEASDPAHFGYPLSAPTMSGMIDSKRIKTDSPFFYHKTTRRAVYNKARKRFPEYEEVLLVNDRDEVMEFTSGNMVIRKADIWLTPALDCGLLPGVFRDKLIRDGIIRESRISITDVMKADNVFFINSVRGWRRVSMNGSFGQ